MPDRIFVDETIYVHVVALKALKRIDVAEFLVVGSHGL